MKQNKLRNESGFSLLEVLISVTLAGVTTAVIAFSFQQAITLQNELDGRITAEVLGVSKLAELETGSQTVSSGDFPSPYNRYKWLTHEVKSAGGTPTIILTVKWNGGNHHTHQKVFKGFLREE